MKMNAKKGMMLGLALTASLFLVAPAIAHHSFAMFDQTKTVTVTGVAYSFVPQANHAEIHFYQIGDDGKLVKDKDGKNVDWGVEMAGAAAMARQGITAEKFPKGTIFSVKVHPLRDGGSFGSLVGALAVCPWKKPPTPGKTCDTVEGHTIIGNGGF